MGMIKLKPQREKNIVVPTVCALPKQNLSERTHQNFGHIFITRLKQMARKGLTEGLL